MKEAYRKGNLKIKKIIISDAKLLNCDSGDETDEQQ